MNWKLIIFPRYWLWWMIIGGLWCLTLLPFSWQLRIGQQIGRLAYRLAPRRRRIATINLQLCFPNLDDNQRSILLKRHFESLGMGFLETLNAWWSSDDSLRSLGQIQGLDYLQSALARGKGVILLSAHFTSLEIGGRLLTLYVPIHATYRPHENPVINYVMRKGREKRVEKAIVRTAIRDMCRSLKQNKPVWFAIDQNFGHKYSVFADFFGIPAATNTATARLAQMSGALVIPFFTQRLADYQGYKVILLPALENFPSDDKVKDALQINQLIEAQVKQAPEQYLWVHRRFKDRPAGEENRFY